MCCFRMRNVVGQSSCKDSRNAIAGPTRLRATNVKRRHLHAVVRATHVHVWYVMRARRTLESEGRGGNHGRSRVRPWLATPSMYCKRSTTKKSANKAYRTVFIRELNAKPIHRGAQLGWTSI